MPKFGTLLSGGELAGVGIRAAGYEHAWGYEIEPEIAAVANANGFGVTAADVLQLDPATLTPVDALHVSTVCTNASTANQQAALNDEGTKESPIDIAMGHKVASIIDRLRPRVFTLENVFAYRNFKAFGLIVAALNRGGYFYDWDHLNAADFGVPQTRQRLILRAVRGSLLPHLPPPTPWLGWYAAIEDLIPTLPPAHLYRNQPCPHDPEGRPCKKSSHCRGHFAAWQLARMPADLREAGVMIDGHNTGQEYGKLHRLASEPVTTLIADGRPSHSPRAFIFAGSGNTNLKDAGPGVGVRYDDEPAHALASEGGRVPRAFLVSGANNDVNAYTKVATRTDDEPSITIGAREGKHPTRAYLAAPNSNAASHGDNWRAGEEPAHTTTPNAKGRARAFVPVGRIVNMTPRALARFMGLPDSYQLPERESLACKIVGNGCCAPMFETIYSQLRQQ